MKLAIPVEDEKDMLSRVSAHVGQAPFFAVYDSNTKELSITVNTAQHGGGGCQAVAALASFSPDLVYSLGMGANALAKCAAQGIEVKTGSFTIVQEVVDNLDNLQEMSVGCEHSHGHGGCH